LEGLAQDQRLTKSFTTNWPEMVWVGNQSTVALLGLDQIGSFHFSCGKETPMWACNFLVANHIGVLFQAILIVRMSGDKPASIMD
jgi:hypothetical protein